MTHFDFYIAFKTTMHGQILNSINWIGWRKCAFLRCSSRLVFFSSFSSPLTSLCDAVCEQKWALESSWKFTSMRFISAQLQYYCIFPQIWIILRCELMGHWLSFEMMRNSYFFFKNIYCQSHRHERYEKKHSSVITIHNTATRRNQN